MRNTIRHTQMLIVLVLVAVAAAGGRAGWDWLIAA